MNVITHLSLEFVKRNRFRNALVILAIALSSFIIFFTFDTTYQKVVEDVYKSNQLNGDYAGYFINVSPEQQELIQSNPGFNTIALKEDKKKIFVDDKALLTLNLLDDIYLGESDIELISGRMPINDNEIVLSEHLLNRLAHDFHEENIVMQVFHYDIDAREVVYEDESFKLVGIMADLSYFERSDRYLYEGLIGGEFLNPEIYYIQENSFDIMAFRTANGIENYQHHSNTHIFAGGYLSTMLPPIVALSVIVLTTSLISIMSIFSYAMIERVKMLGLMRAVGMTRKQLRHMIFIEKGIVSIVGISIGLLMVVVIHFMKVIYEQQQGRIYVGIFDGYLLLAMIVTALIVYGTVSLSYYLTLKKTNAKSVVSLMRFSGEQVKKTMHRSKAVTSIIREMALRRIGNHKYSFMFSSILFALAVGSFMFIMTLFNSIQSERLEKLYCMSDILIEYDHATVDFELPEDMIQKVKGIEGIEKIGYTNYTSINVSDATLKRDGTQTYETDVYSYDPWVLDIISDLNRVDSGLSEDECYLHDNFNYSNLEVDDEVILNNKTYRVKGIISSVPNEVNRENDYFTPIFVVAQLPEAALKVQLILDVNEDKYNTVTNTINGTIASKELDMIFIDQVRVRLLENGKSTKLAMYGLSFMLALIHFTMIINNIITSISYRRRTFGMLRAIGMERGQMRRQLYLEGLLLATSGSLLGIIIGAISSFFVVNDMASVNVHIEYSFSWTSVSIVIFYAMAIMITTYISIKNIDKLSVIQNIRHT